jgi:hypothetical protein
MKDREMGLVRATMKRLVLGILCFGAQIAHADTSPGSATQNALPMASDDEVEVYSAVLRTIANESGASHLALRSILEGWVSEGDPRIPEKLEELKRLEIDTLALHARRNRTDARLGKPLSIGVPMSFDDGPEGPPPHRPRYSLSRVGFNPRHTQALVSVCYVHDNQGDYTDYVLARSRGTWRIVERSETTHSWSR